MENTDEPGRVTCDRELARPFASPGVSGGIIVRMWREEAALLARKHFLGEDLEEASGTRAKICQANLQPDVQPYIVCAGSCKVRNHTISCRDFIFLSLYLVAKRCSESCFQMLSRSAKSPGIDNYLDHLGPRLRPTASKTEVMLAWLSSEVL
jgi:hypothetical protein